DLVALPYLDAEQSGVLYTALAFGKPLVLSSVGGFPEIAATGAARLVPPGDAEALRGALAELTEDEQARAELAAAARAASDGSSDATAARAREAGADIVLELDPGGKVTALNAGVEAAAGELLAFSDANSAWEPAALRRLVEPFADPAVGYVCGQVRFLDS